MRLISTLMLAATTAASATVAVADEARTPQIICSTTSNSLAISKLSDNGRWGIATISIEDETDGTVYAAGGVLTDMENPLADPIEIPVEGYGATYDITDDGNIAVGTLQGAPAFYNRTTGAWTKLTIPDGYVEGMLIAVTPDGKTAVGYVAPEGSYGMVVEPVIYDLATGQLLSTEGVARLDMNHQDKKQNAFTDISADGRYVLGNMSQSHLEVAHPSPCEYVYDRETKTSRIIGYIPDDTDDWVPLADYIWFVDGGSMSADGHYVGGSVYMYKPIAGSEYGDGYRAAYVYDVWADKFTLYDGPGDSDIDGVSISNDGNLFVSTPAKNPYASMMIRSGKYYYSLEQILKQAYGIDFYEKTGLDVTGKPIDVSGDGRTIVSVSYTDCFILKLNEPIDSACARVNLLANYAVSPASGSVFSTLSTVTLTFERDIATTAAASAVKLCGPDGAEIRGAASAKVEGKKLTLGFRSTDMAAGQVYTIKVPAGFVIMAEDSDVQAAAIEIQYTGRSKAPVAVLAAYPESGTQLAKLDYSTSPVLLQFDAYLQLTSGASAALYRGDDADPTCLLSLAVGEDKMLVYPNSTQYLYSGTDYRIVIPAGSVTDLSGNGGNEEITLRYTGVYEREISADDKYLFNEDCSTYVNFMFYEGDGLTPQTVPAGWGFDALTPWFIVRSSAETTDVAMAAHSMYTPAGRADDWMVIPQLYMPDEHCYLAFDAQSYLATATDSLKVYVLTCDEVHNTVDRDFADRILAEGTLAFAERLTPGASEEDLEDDWVKYTVDLAAYADKNIYIAFVNDNYDQSAIFLDNIQVIHDMNFLVSLENETTVVARDGITIQGSIIIDSDIKTYTDLTLVLATADGTEVSRIAESGLSLAKGDSYRFTFPTQLPLAVGAVTTFTVTATLGDDVTTLKSTVRDLAFSPSRRVVLEEYAGSACGNCPLGILAIEKIESLYPDNFIPICVRTYSGDVLGTGLSSYSSFLGCENVGAPSGRIDRGDIASPMASTGSSYAFTGAGLVESATGAPVKVWLDYVQEELAQPSIVDIAATASYDAATATVVADCSLRFALNSVGQNLTLFGVLVEDGLETYQLNYFTSVADANLGEWGAGGSYGSTVYPYVANDVARGCYGTTFNGYAGLIPSAVTAAETYEARIAGPLPGTVANADNCSMVIMVIDANTDRVVNAVKASLSGASAIHRLAADSQAVRIWPTAGRALRVAADGAFRATVYDVSGALVATADASDTAEIAVGRTGLWLVKVETAEGVTTAKVVIP